MNLSQMNTIELILSHVYILWNMLHIAFTDKILIESKDISFIFRCRRKSNYSINSRYLLKKTRLVCILFNTYRIKLRLSCYTPNTCNQTDFIDFIESKVSHRVTMNTQQGEVNGHIYTFRMVTCVSARY